jgi:hypothetical protein
MTHAYLWRGHGSDAFMQTSRFGFKPKPPPFIFSLSSLYRITYSSLSFTTTHWPQCAMLCTANNCRRKAYKKLKWTVTFTQIIYQIWFRWLQRRMIDNAACHGQQQMLYFYATKSTLPSSVTDASASHQICIRGIVTEKRDMKLELILQSKAKVSYQHDLAADIPMSYRTKFKEKI